MCHRRRVYFSCLHEDHDVTPPRPLLFCHDAKPSESGDVNSNAFGNLKPCAPIETLALTSKLDLLGGVVRSEPCEACAADTGDDGTTSNAQGRCEGEDGSESTFTASEDRTEPEEDEDLFAFDWDGDNGFLPNPPRAAEGPVGGNQSSESAHGANAPAMESTYVGTEQDFQLYDGEDEFADELREISSKER
ncbi:hypothetical protein F5Y05DRAFT_381182 [Hypoxylon sp. FL0543]|nr:hypothetical protein F5Y05DRAFT_381182 [Hypoxylon sp. FL0543]